MPVKKIEVPDRKCEHCGETYQRKARRPIANYMRARFCSRKCAGAHRTVLADIACKFCGKVFSPERFTSTFCSPACSSRSRPARLGKPARYKKIKTPDGRQLLEHRYVMEQAIGRQLYPWESVHHKNGDRKDNRLDNLELWANNHGSGSRVEDLILFVAANYREEVIRALGP